MCCIIFVWSARVWIVGDFVVVDYFKHSLFEFCTAKQRYCQLDTVYRWKNIGCDAFRTLNIERYTVKRAITFIVSLQCFLSLIICITLLLTWTDHCYSLDIKWVCRIFTLELSHIVFGVLFFDQSKYIDIAIEALNLRHLAIYFMRLIQNNKNSALERLFVT